MYKVMIIEDELNIRIELKTILENALYEVVLVDDFENVANKIINYKPDIVLLDVNLPNQNGMEICSEVRKKSDTPIIFVTSRNTSMDELNCITLGGDDYITKPYNPPILLARISSLLKRVKKSSVNDDNILEHRGVTLDVLTATIKCNDKEANLSKNEFRILYYLFKNKEKIVNRIELVEYLWDNQAFVDDNSLSVNITRIRNKLQSIGVNDFIETKRGLGYKIWD